MRFFFLGERLAVDLLNTVVVQDGRVHLLQGPMDVAAWAEAAGGLPHRALGGSAAGQEPEPPRGVRGAPRRGGRGPGRAGVGPNPAPSIGGAGRAPVVVQAAGRLPSLNGDAIRYPAHAGSAAWMKAWPVRSSATPRDGHLRFGRVHRGQLVATELLLAPRLGGQDAVARSDRRPRGRRVAPPGLEPGLPNPELRRGGLFGGHHVRKW